MTDTAVAPPPPPPINVAFLGRRHGAEQASAPVVRPRRRRSRGLVESGFRLVPRGRRNRRNRGLQMRLRILDRGHPLRTTALFAVIRVVSRQPVVDAVKLAFYRPYFYGAGDLTHETMRGPSDWSIGDRELMAAVVSGQ
ncbi:MAG: hypothetical protein ACXWZI_01610 [Mycobacterium sp.]